LRVRSMVGLIPLFAIEVLDDAVMSKMPDFTVRMHWVLSHRPELARLVSRWLDQNEDEQHLLSLLRGHRMKYKFRPTTPSKSYSKSLKGQPDHGRGGRGNDRSR
jgi:hypothetical protein